MSRRAQKRVPTDGDASGDGAGTTPLEGLDDLTEKLALKKKVLPPKATTERTAMGKARGKVKSMVKSKGRVEVRREKAGRGGKTVTTVRSFPSDIPLKTLETTVFELKKQCACGGTLKGRVIELQGDVCQKVCCSLKSRGYQAVRAGG